MGSDRPETESDAGSNAPSERAPPDDADSRPHGRWRPLAALLALVLAFAAAAMALAMVDIGGTPGCDDPAALAEERAETGATEVECFDGSQRQKVLSVVLGSASGLFAAFAAVVALVFALTGHRGGLMIRLTAAAIVLGGLGILVGSV